MKIVLFILLAFNLHADIKQEMLNFYQNKKFEEACTLGFNNFKYNKKDEEFISLYAFSCLHSDYIDRLAVPIAMLKFSKEARANSAYLSTILMQKKLLYHALVDSYDLSSLKFPSTDYVLSRVFDFYTELGVHEQRDVYFFVDKDDEKLTYKLYLTNDEKLKKIVIEEFYDTIIIKKHIYW
ncbi:MAG: hypothetical protein M0Q24_03010 [Sulfurimonas sp.]|uniref:hypothetical protein n=1 Tax=Sulfurimonas sp. TaxID=2022749 RepID=UPI0025EDA55A|nr:hypothetical protein [Sulfurimonas sp.]MCK9491035.1 hypothetical protein [Sulfurimonas sp.]